MLRVSVTDLKNRLSEYLRRVKRGETIEVLERSVVIARIEGRTAPVGGEEEQLERLEREGVLRRPQGAPDLSLLDFEPIPCTADAVRTLIEERGER